MSTTDLGPGTENTILATKTSERLATVREQIHRACIASDRDPNSVTLITVSKTQPAEVISDALSAGVQHLGENRVQEAKDKGPLVKGQATWHLIGPLQRNKVTTALQVFDVVHTLDRESLADRLQYLLSEHWPERILPVLIEVNLGREQQKAGVLPDETIHLARRVLEDCPALRLDGLMAIPPFGEDPEESRPYFRELRILRDRLSQNLGAPLPHLSMGMSHDFEVAIAEGATMVRVGTAIFGPRMPRS